MENQTLGNIFAQQNEKDMYMTYAIGHLQSTWNTNQDGVTVATIVDPKQGLVMTATSNWDDGHFTSAEEQVLLSSQSDGVNRFSDAAYAVTIVPPSLTEKNEDVAPSYEHLKNAGIDKIYTWAPQSERAALSESFASKNIKIEFTDDPKIAEIASVIYEECINDDLHKSQESNSGFKRKSGRKNIFNGNISFK